MKTNEGNLGNLSDVKLAIVAANKHYAGFGPGTVNIFRQLVGLKEVGWGDEDLATDDVLRKENDSTKNHINKAMQTSLSEFFQNSSFISHSSSITSTVSFWSVLSKDGKS
jgi:hypothetical protein